LYAGNCARRPHATACTAVINLFSAGGSHVAMPSRGRQRRAVPRAVL